MAINLRPYQIDAVKRMSNGSILCGGVGSGKSRTALAYYIYTQGGKIFDENKYEVPLNPCDLYIITTARKRDTMEWEDEMIPFLLFPGEDNYYINKIVVDSWNNIKKYVDVKDAFFIFDEQRVVGYGTWTKSFLKITKANKWILLSATPGDTWMDYIPVFIANGFYKNKTEFVREHVVYSTHSNFPKVDRYINTGRLIRLRNKILVNMEFNRETISHHYDIYVDYNLYEYKKLMKERWNYEKEEPIENITELCYQLRKIINSDPGRLIKTMEIAEEKKKVIIFYNFDYELELLKNCFEGTTFEVAEWNGHKHQSIPSSKQWIYLVQYNAGAEGWNCIQTDTIIFYSQNYSYKIMVQSSGRIDRLNTPFSDLYYYHLKSRSGIDLAISKALQSKKKFNESNYISKI